MWKDILKEIARRGDEEGTLPEPTPEFLSEIWPALVGASVSRMSSPLRLEERTLHIAARNPSLVDDWKESPLPLLRRLRRFAPWPIETLEITHDPGAGVVDRDDRGESPDAHRTTDASPTPNPPVESTTDESIDSELRTILESIDRHRKERDGDG